MLSRQVEVVQSIQEYLGVCIGVQVQIVGVVEEANSCLQIFGILVED